MNYPEKFNERIDPAHEAHISLIASDIYAVRNGFDAYWRINELGTFEDSRTHDPDAIHPTMEEWVGNNSELRGLIDDDEYGISDIVRIEGFDNAFKAMVWITDLDRMVDRKFEVQFSTRFERLNFISFYGKTSGTFEYSVHDFLVTGYSEEASPDDNEDDPDFFNYR